MDTSCCFEYADNALTPYRKAVFEHVTSHIKGGDVLDIGSGPTGYYWCLDYANRVNSITLSDRNTEYIQTLEESLGTITPQNITEQFQPTLEHLHADAHTMSRAIATALHTKRKDSVIIDCEKPQTFVSKTYDYITAIGVVECASTQDKLHQSIINLTSLLKRGGTLLVAILPHASETTLTKTLTQQGLDGAFQFDIAALQRFLKNHTYTKHSSHISIPTNIANYPNLEILRIKNTPL